jgi:hypothetical protein
MTDDLAQDVPMPPRPSFWRRNAPPWLIIFLAPAIGELLSGSSPPTEFFNAFGFPVMTILYGFGALLVREYSLLWGRGWHRVLLLGAAYGIVEEGLLCRSFFDPNWPDLGPLASYGRWAGTNWVWSLNLTIYHIFVSVALPILLAELAFPAIRSVNWTNRRGRIALLIFFLADVVLAPLGIQHYFPPLHLTVALALVVALVVLARRWDGPRMPSLPAVIKVPRPAVLGLIGFAATFGFFVLQYVIPQTKLPPVCDLALVAIVGFLFGRFLYFRTGAGRAWGELHRFSLVAGVLMIFILISPLQEFGKQPNKPHTFTGQSIVGLIFLLGLAALWWRIMKRRPRPEPPPAQDSPTEVPRQ